MAERHKRESRQHKTAYRLLLIQALATLLLAAVGFWAKSSAALPLIVGGAIGVTANGWLALVVFRPGSAASPEKLLRSLYLGELGKFLFVMAFFAVAFKSLPMAQRPENALLMLMAFAATQVLHWLWPLMEKKPNKPE